MIGSGKDVMHNSQKSEFEQDSRLNTEIEHGKKIAGNAGSVWNWESPAGQRRWARRLEILTKHIEPEMNVLEIGCGTGYYTKELVKTGAKITAIDISPDLLEVAKKTVPSSMASFMINNAYEMTFEDNKFDTIVGCSVLHHLDINKAIKEIYRVLKPGGVIKFSEPNMLNPQIAIQKNVPFVKEKMGDSPFETAFFKWQMQRILQKEKFQDISVVPFDFLHPAIPQLFVPFFEKICLQIEKIPVLKEIAGSLYIEASKK